MSDNRNYSTGDQAALMVLCKGACYMPGCGVPAVVEIEPDLWVLNLQRAHIAAVSPKGPRYGELPGVDVNSFANMLLLCTPHHALVDKIDPSRFPLHTLLKWKTLREKGGHDALAGLTNLTEERLQDLVSDAIAGYHQKMEALIARVDEFDSSAASMLRALSDDLSDFRSGQHGPDPDVTSMLHDAASRLPDEDAICLLSEAAGDLKAWSIDSISQLAEATAKLRNLDEGLINQLCAAVEQLEKATQYLPDH